MNRKIPVVVAIVLGLISEINAQKFGIGASGIYNLQTNSLGYGIRVHYQARLHWAIVPEYSRYPGFNPIFETYIGANLHYLLNLNSPRIYLIAGLAYNNWKNYMDYHNDRAKSNNLAEELGVGLQFGNCCLRPFLELRYNANWGEGNIRLGLLYFFGKCCDKKGRKGGSGGGHKGSGYCPAYFD